VHHSRVRLPRPFAPHPGRILAADLSEPVLVTAYEDGRAVYSALAIKGSGPWATPTGAFRIQRRVADETMDSATLGIPRGAPNGYYLPGVLNTQYFTADGASIHYNWWSGSFGYAGSHGCLGVDLADSQFFWDWADVGTPVFIHH
jgi:lipoprotein-anchoring transpeptidase ErfK/SrfK